MVDPTFGYAFNRRANEKVLLVTEFSSKQERWFGTTCVNIYSDKRYKMVDYTQENNPSHNVVFPSQFARLLIEYQEHPESKSLAPDGTACEADTSGLLQRAHIIAGEFRYVGMRREQGYSASMLIEESRVFQVATFNTLHLHQSELDQNQLLLDVMVIADEVDAQLKETVSSLLGKRLVRAAALRRTSALPCPCQLDRRTIVNRGMRSFRYCLCIFEAKIRGRKQWNYA